MAHIFNGKKLIHTRVEGRSLDIPCCDLEIGPQASDAEIKHAVARRLQIADSRLRDYVIDRHDTGNLTIRPEAVFG